MNVRDWRSRDAERLPIVGEDQLEIPVPGCSLLLCAASEVAAKSSRRIRARQHTVPRSEVTKKPPSLRIEAAGRKHWGGPSPEIADVHELLPLIPGTTPSWSRSASISPTTSTPTGSNRVPDEIDARLREVVPRRDQCLRRRDGADPSYLVRPGPSSLDPDPRTAISGRGS